MKSLRPIRTGLINSLVLLGLVVVILGPRFAAGWVDLKRAHQAFLEVRYAEASLYYAAAARRLPVADAWWERAGLSALAAGLAEDARKYLEQARNLSASGRIALGDAYLALDDSESALALWQDLEAEGHVSADLFFRLAQLQESRGDFIAAISYLYALRGLAPTDLEARYRLGLLLSIVEPETALSELTNMLSTGNATDARLEYLRSALSATLLEIDPAYRQVNVGRALAVLGEWNLSKQVFRDAVRHNPFYAEAWAWLGEAYQQTGLDGLPELQRANQLNPDSAMSRALYGLYWMRQGQPEAALRSLSVAVRLEPENAAWQVMLGDAYVLSADLIQALASYQRATELAPNEADYWFALANFCLRYSVDLNQSAFTAASRLLTLAPDDWRSFDTMGQVMLALDRSTEAENYLQRAVQAAPEEAAVHLHLGLVYLYTGDWVGAYDHIVRAIRLDPGGEFGLQAERLLVQYYP